MDGSSLKEALEVWSIPEQFQAVSARQSMLLPVVHVDGEAEPRLIAPAAFTKRVKQGGALTSLELQVPLLPAAVATNARMQGRNVEKVVFRLLDLKYPGQVLTAVGRVSNSENLYVEGDPVHAVVDADPAAVAFYARCKLGMKRSHARRRDGSFPVQEVFDERGNSTKTLVFLDLPDFDLDDEECAKRGCTYTHGALTQTDLKR